MLTATASILIGLLHWNPHWQCFGNTTCSVGATKALNDLLTSTVRAHLTLSHVEFNVSLFQELISLQQTNLNMHLLCRLMQGLRTGRVFFVHTLTFPSVGYPEHTHVQAAPVDFANLIELEDETYSPPTVRDVS